MAINKVFFPNSEPVDDTDWSKMVLQQQYIALGINNPVNYDFTSNTIKQGSMFIAGQSVYLAASDTAITGTVSNYVKLTVSGDTLVPSYVTDLTGVTWNSTYNHYGDASVNAYTFDEMLAVYNGDITVPKTINGYMALYPYFKGELMLDNNIKMPNSSYVFFKSTGASEAQIGVRSDNQLLLESASGGFTFQDNLNTKNLFRIEENGDATHSDKLTVGGDIAANGDLEIAAINSAARSVHQRAFRFIAGDTQNTVYSAVAPYINSVIGNRVGCIGDYYSAGASIELNEIHYNGTNIEFIDNAGNVVLNVVNGSGGTIGSGALSILFISQ